MFKTILAFLLGLMLLNGCGDEADDTVVSDDAAVESLDYLEKMAVCDDLIAVAPASCWQAENRWVYGKTRAADGAPSVEMQMCLSALLAHDGAVSVAEMKACYADADEESCEVDVESCGPVTPVNINGGDSGVVPTSCADTCDNAHCADMIAQCTHDLSCDQWDNPSNCYAFCCPSGI